MQPGLQSYSSHLLLVTFITRHIYYSSHLLLVTFIARHIYCSSGFLVFICLVIIFAHAVLSDGSKMFVKSPPSLFQINMSSTAVYDGVVAIYSHSVNVD